MDKVIKISEELKTKIVNFCDDELGYHIHESGCAKEYAEEIEAQIELLRLLGYKEMADAYEGDYHEALDESKADEYEEYEDGSYPVTMAEKEMIQESKIRVANYSLRFNDVKVIEALNMIEKDADFGNGHAGYMVCGIYDEEAFKKYLAALSVTEKVGICKFKYDKEKETAWFDTYEKYGPGFAEQISIDYAGTTVYGVSMWDDIFDSLAICKYGKEVLSKTVHADFSLNSTFEDEGNLRIDVDVTDKNTEAVLAMGDLVCFGSVQDVARFEDGPEYDFVCSYLCQHEKDQVFEQLNACNDYWERENER